MARQTNKEPIMDLLKTFGPLIGSVAPTIATALGGPIFGLGVKALSMAFFGHENGTADDLATALSNPTAEQLAALKKIDADFKVQMKSLDIDLERIAANDRASARQMQTENKSPLVPTLAILIIGGFLAVITLKIYGVQISNDPMVSDLITTLRDGVMLVLAFYFGSSSGSQRKDMLLYNSVPKE